MIFDFYVSNMPFDATEEDLRKLFEVAGKVKAVTLVIDRKTGLFKGSGFVKMIDVKVREVVETLDGALLGNRQISVSEALPKKPGTANTGGGRERSARENRPDRRRN